VKGPINLERYLFITTDCDSTESLAALIKCSSSSSSSGRHSPPIVRWFRANNRHAKNKRQQACP